MEDRKYLNIDELLVWSDNPRHGLQVDEEEISEEETINILIDVVGTEKMYNLIYDIFFTKGLMGNVNPVVVPHEDKYYVYDGNRRVSALKILKNPSLIESKPENMLFQTKVLELVEGEDVSFADKVFVYITDEEEALEIMDKTHSGEQQGVGMMSWEPYQRDVSLYKRGKTLQYQYAFDVAQALGYKTTKSFKIPYTDLNRLFGSKMLQESFEIDKKSPNYATKVEYIVGMLLKYKLEKRFRSFSRQFNLTAITTDDAPINAFCSWVKEQERTRKNFYFDSTPVDIFVDEEYSFDMLQLRIYNAQGEEIAYDMEELHREYISPNGITSDAVSNSEAGEWQVEIEYEGEKHTETICIKPFLPPKIEFVPRKEFGQGNTIDLRTLMLRATDGHGCDVKDKVTISPVGDAIIIMDTFAADNSLGSYQIAYAFKDITGAPHSVTKEIRIIDESNPLLAENKHIPLLSFNGTQVTIDISNVVNRMITEINILSSDRESFESNKCILLTALRVLVELSFDELHTKRIITFIDGNLENHIEKFKRFLLDNNKDELIKLCTKYPATLSSYHAESNWVAQIDPTSLSSRLNLAAHRSISRIDVIEMAEIANKYISPILVYTSLLLK